MSQRPSDIAETLTPILYVKEFSQSVRYYSSKLLFEKLWAWGKPPGFGAVRLGKVEVFFCVGAQGQPGTWLYIFVNDVDDYFEKIKRRGAEVIRRPKDEPWGMREIHVRDPNHHVIRFGTGVPRREPKMTISRVPLKVRVEKRLAALLSELAKHKKMTLGEMLEETMLHTFEEVPTGGVASPHTKKTLDHIKILKKKMGIDYDCHASYRFTEKKGKC